MRWQEVAKIIATPTVLLVILGILNLTSMVYSIPPDINCLDCYSKVQVNSTFWEIKVEHSGDKPILYKKMSRSRTLWINLDKINSFIPTEPQVFVEILVPTVKRFSTTKHPKFGYLRTLNDGDKLIERKNKWNPDGDWFVVHGLNQDGIIKWGFNIDNYLTDGIEFDPIWNPALAAKQLCRNITSLVNVTKEFSELINETYYDWVDFAVNVSCDSNNISEHCSQYTNNSYYKTITVSREKKTRLINHTYKKEITINKTDCVYYDAYEFDGKNYYYKKSYTCIDGDWIVTMTNEGDGTNEFGCHCPDDNSMVCSKKNMKTGEVRFYNSGHYKGVFESKPLPSLSATK